MRKTELRALTGVRFYAALFVFFSHMPIVAGMDALSGQRVVFNAGVVGVSFFFVLSGFILTYNYAHVFEEESRRLPTGVFSGTGSQRFIRCMWPRWCLSFRWLCSVRTFRWTGGRFRSISCCSIAFGRLRRRISEQT